MTIAAIIKKNQHSEELLNKLFIKHCTKACPNPKCNVPITKLESGCGHIQCPCCHCFFCWTCGFAAKGQKHFKEFPDHYSDEGQLLPLEVTQEIISKFGGNDIEWLNIRFAAMCPSFGCGKIMMKDGNNNMLECTKCN